LREAARRKKKLVERDVMARVVGDLPDRRRLTSSISTPVPAGHRPAGADVTQRWPSTATPSDIPAMAITQ
jgi:hypothetical protein